jgi:hypothetical protein
MIPAALERRRKNRDHKFRILVPNFLASSETIWIVTTWRSTVCDPNHTAKDLDPHNFLQLQASGTTVPVRVTCRRKWSLTRGMSTLVESRRAVRFFGDAYRGATPVTFATSARFGSVRYFVGLESVG